MLFLTLLFINQMFYTMLTSMEQAACIFPGADSWKWQPALYQHLPDLQAALRVLTQNSIWSAADPPFL